MGSATAAQASNSKILALVKSDLPKITRSQAKILDGLATLQKTHSASALIKAIDTQNTDLKALQSRLTGQKPSSSAGTKGKTDLVNGLSLIIGSNSTLAHALQKASSGQSVSKSALKAADAADKKGNADMTAGVKLLTPRAGKTT